MSVDVEGCVEILKAFWSKKWIHSQDAYIAPLDFQEDMYYSKEKLRIGKPTYQSLIYPILGYFDTNGCIEPIPVMKRAVHETRQRLERDGHELIKFEPPTVNRAYHLFMMAVTLDNGRWILERWDKVVC